MNTSPPSQSSSSGYVEKILRARVYDAEAYRFAFTVMILFLASGLVAALALGRSLRRLRQATT